MSSLTVAGPTGREVAERQRAMWFVALLAAAAIGAGCHTASLGPIGTAIVAVPYVGWIWTDLQARGVHGWSFTRQLALACVPGAGLVLYMLWSRGLAGLVQGLAFALALAVPALIGSLFFGLLAR